MQDHFNESYLESELFPLSIFKGNFSSQSEEKKQTIVTDGRILIHGVEQNISINTDLVTQGEEIIFTSQFYIQLKDFDIKIPKMFTNNISEEIEVIVKGNLIPLK